MAAIASASTTAAIPVFYLFRSPMVTNPSYELVRRLGNAVYKRYYRYSIEPGYTDEKFLNGVKKGICRCAEGIRTQNYEQLTPILTATALRQLRRRIEELPPADLAANLSFEEADISHSFLYSYLMSTDKFLGLAEGHRLTFYATAVAFIEKPGVPAEKRSAKTNAEDKLICNISFGRIVEPLGRWRVTDVNFFDGRALRYL